MIWDSHEQMLILFYRKFLNRLVKTHTNSADVFAWYDIIFLNIFHLLSIRPV